MNENKTRLHCIINMPKTLTNQYFISFTIQHFIPSTFKSLHQQHPQNKHCKWVDMNTWIKVDDLGYTLVNLNRLGFLNDPFVLAKHVKQVCYIDDPLEKLWSICVSKTC